MQTFLKISLKMHLGSPYLQGWCYFESDSALKLVSQLDILRIGTFF